LPNQGSIPDKNQKINRSLKNQRKEKKWGENRKKKGKNNTAVKKKDTVTCVRRGERKPVAKHVECSLGRDGK